MSKLRWREPFEVCIENLSHEGRGVGRVNGKTIFVRGALPGETALVSKTRGRKSFDEGLALEISNPNGVSKGVKQITIDGKALDSGSIIPILPAGEYHVNVELGN